jgi:hypothetical protein
MVRYGWDLLTLDFDAITDQMVEEILWFADDVVVVSPQQELLQEVLGAIQGGCKWLRVHLIEQRGLWI